MIQFGPVSNNKISLIERQRIVKPLIDQNEYKFLELGKLKVLLIRDPSATVAEAALCVQVGSWMDPKEHQGLAHFLEHMLF